MIRKPAEMQTEARERMRGGTGTVTIRHAFTKDDMKAACRLCATLTIPPGAGIGTHEHATEDEVYFVIRGSGLLDDGHTRRRIEPGDAILTGRGESHAVLNDGTVDLEIVAVIMCY